MERRRDPQAMPTLGGQVLPVGGIAEKVLAAHRGGLRRVILPGPNRRQVDHDLDDGIRRAVGVDYVTRVDELLELAFGGARRLPTAWRRSRRVHFENRAANARPDCTSRRHCTMMVTPSIRRSPDRVQ